jgi:hypothetical protein
MVKYGVLLLLVLAAALLFIESIAFSQEGEGSVISFLRTIIQNQEQIIEQLGEMMQELKIVKIRASIR